MNEGYLRVRVIMSAISILSIGAYLTASIALSKGISTSNTKSKKLGLLIGTFASIAHGYVLYTLIDTPLGHNLSLSNLSSMVAWLITLVLLATNSRTKVHGLTALMMFISTLSIVATLTTNSTNLVSKLSPGTTSHILLALVTVSFLLITGSQALLIAVQNYYLRKDPLNKILRYIPPLETNEILWSTFLNLSFVLLTLTLIFTKAYLEISTATWLSKGSFTIIAWALLGGIVWGNYRYGFQGTKARWWSIIAGILILFAYIASKALMQGDIL